MFPSKLLVAISIIACGAAALGDEPVVEKKEDMFSGFSSRTGTLREKLMRDGGATAASEAAVAKGLGWLARVQEENGRWKLDGKFPDKGNPSDAAATGLALLPFLGAGRTHLPTKDNPYDEKIKRGLDYLIGIQDKDTGAF